MLGAVKPGGRPLLCASLLAATALSSPALAGPVLPSGGKVAAGTAVIGAPSNGSLSISQSSSKAIIDWGSFSIGKGGAVAFDNGKGATLNRVTGSQVSSLDGLLSATGSVYLINANGVIIGKSGVVDVGGTFVASTLDISNAGFLSGGALSFTGPSAAAVVNYGKIGALGGDVALIAATVSNAGTINAANGDAGLLAGTRVVLRDASLDEGRFAVELGGAGVSATNSGLIAAADVELRAEQGNVYALAGDTAGVVRATGTKSGGGHVWLVADGGTLDVAGTLQAQGVGQTAGSIETSGSTVGLRAASIDAHGGTWLVDPDDLTIDATAAMTIDNALNAGTSVIEQTTATGTSGAGTVNTAGNGDIIVAAPLTWTTNAALTLSAFRDVTLNPAGLITSTGGGAVTLQADNTGTGVGTVNFGLASGVSTSGAVTIFYNPASFSDAATKSTQSYGGAGQGSRNYANPYTSDVTGGGTLLAYMLVNTLPQLEAVSTELDGVYALTHDLDASSSATMNPIDGGGYAGWTPIGVYNGTAFTGTLNGQGHIINGLYINSTTSGIGLFGSLGDPALISNLGVTNANVTGTGDANGILAGAGTGATDLINVYTTGTISGFSDTGGLYGKGASYISDSYSTASVSGGGSTGGLAGNATGALTNVYATGAVNGASQSVGGLIGYFTGSLNNGYATGAVSDSSGGDVGGLIGQAGGSVANAYATGSVTDTGGGDQNAGGLIGVASGNGNGPLTYQNIYATGAVTSAGGQVGGLIGYTLDSAIVTDAFATGAVTAAGPRVGGLIGINDGTLSQSYAGGAVTGSGDVGGLVGFNSFYPASGTITDSYATGSVTGVQSADPTVVNYIGGLVGTNNHYPDVNNTSEGSITRSYATGAVSGVGVLGGLVGGNSGAITNAIWDRTSTGQASGVGVTLLVNGTDTSAVTNLTSVQDTDPTAVDYAFSTTPYTHAGFQFGTTPGGASGQTWVQVDTDGSFNGTNSQNDASVGTRPFLLMEYTTTITNAHQLQLIALGQTANYILASDVDASGTATTAGMWGPGGFVPLGQTFYSGTFDGQGFSIGGLTMTNSGDTGLFADLLGTVENVSLVGGAIVGTGTDPVGALAAEAASSVGAFPGSFNAVNSSPTGGSILNSSSSASISGNGYVGGLVGESNSFITGSSSSGLVTALPVTITTTGGANGPVTQTYQPEFTGGLLGDSLGATVTNSFASGAVTGGTYVGGLIGSYDAAGTPTGSVTNAYATGAVSGVTGVGGLIGATLGPAMITDTYATGLVAAAGPGDGGLIGAAQVYTNPFTGADISNATVIDSYATGSVSGSTQVGGLVGYAEDLTTITGSAVGKTYASGSVTGVGGATATGGLVGENAGTITQASYTPTGAGVSGYSATGGLVGQDDPGASVTNSFSTGAVTSFESYTGGLVGLSNDALVTGSYATGQVNGGDDTGGLVGSAVGGTTSAISNSYATGNVRAQFVSVGGLVGSSTANITDSYATGAVTSAQQGVAGGLVGVLGFSGFNDTYGAATLLDSYATGAVSGSSYIGGLVGRVEAQSAVTGSAAGKTYATGLVTGTNLDIGGLVGQNAGTITLASYSGPNVSGGTAVGAGVGENQSGGIVTQGSAVSPVQGESEVGGLVGVNDAGGDVADSFATGNVNGMNQVGGLVGLNAGPGVLLAVAPVGPGPLATPANVGVITGSTPTATYATGLVIGTGSSTGGLVGENGGTISQAAYLVAGGAGVLGVSGGADVGGLVGRNDAGATITLATALTGVTGTSYTGGVVGDNFGPVSMVNYGGAVSGGGGVGGIVGVNEGGGTVDTALAGVAAPSTVTGTGDDVGGIAGASFGKISTLTSKADVSGRDDVGGVVGYNAASEIGTSDDNTVTGRDYVGGLVGLNYAQVQGHASSLVNGVTYVGGDIGWNDAQGVASAISSTAVVTATGDYAGGLVGVNKGMVSMSEVGPANAIIGSVTGADYVGGLVGLNQGSITQSFSLIPVSGGLYVGGLVGWNDTGATVQTSYASGAVYGASGKHDAAGNDYVGGLVGVNFGSLANVYATGSVSGVQVVGGLVGTNMAGGASVSYGYSTGAVSASLGAAGTSFGVQAGEVTDVYGFPALSGQAVASGYFNTPSAIGDATLLTPAQEDGSAAYVGFDFTNVWQSNPDGPPTFMPFDEIQ